VVCRSEPANHSLGVFGAGHGLLLAGGHVRAGGFAPAALFWLFALPVSRMIQADGREQSSGGAGLPA
jgi:hypothetical protein